MDFGTHAFCATQLTGWRQQQPRRCPSRRQCAAAAARCAAAAAARCAAAHQVWCAASCQLRIRCGVQQRVSCASGVVCSNVSAARQLLRSQGS
eukprot:363590-Chlamydomonas_euryale.AAC.3